MNRYRLSILTAAALAMGGLLSSPAHAADGKVLPGSACLPYSPANGDIVQRFAQYIRNTSSSNSALVMCPVVKDIVGGTSLSYIRIGYRKVSSSGFYCAIYAKTGTGGGSHSSSEWDFGSAGTKYMVLPNIPGYSNGTYSLYCILPPGAEIHSYRVDES